MAMKTQRKWVSILVMLAVLLLVSAGPGYADRGRHGFRGHGFRGHVFKGHEVRGHGFRHHHHRFRGSHRFGGPRVFIRPSIVVPFGLYGRPYWDAYPYPPVVVAPPPVYVQPSPPVVAAPPPPQYWYWCDSAQAYYPYVAQCPSGWRAVTPTPP